ncbi:hypothetical protein [Actinoplanes sp. NPDC089786]
MSVRGRMVLYVVLALGVSGGVAGAAAYNLRDDLALDRRGEKATG